MLNNGLLILTLIWSLMRMANFTHDSNTSVITLILHMVFLFHIWYLMLGFVRNMKLFYSEDLFWFQRYWSMGIIHGNCRPLFRNSMVVIQTLFTNFTLLCHIYVEWFVHQLPQICESWLVPHVGQVFTLSGTPDFTPFGEFMISPIHYIHAYIT